MEGISLIHLAEEFRHVGHGKTAVAADHGRHTLKQRKPRTGLVVGIGGHVVHMAVDIDKAGANHMPRCVQLHFRLERSVGKRRDAAVLYAHRSDAGGFGFRVDHQPVVDTKRIHGEKLLF